jgi:chromosomal replication initiation ATPase DnaA
MCVNHREASEPGRSCPRSANAAAPSIEAIQQAVAEAFEVSIDDLSGRRPTLQINNYPEQVRKARKAALYLCRELTTHNATRIAERFGRKPAVVKRAVGSVRAIIDSDLDLASRLVSAAQRLQADLSQGEEDNAALFTEQPAQDHRHQ